MKKQNQKKSFFMWWIISIGAIAGIAFLIATSQNSHTSSKTSREVALTCTTEMATKFHIHPTLEIDINGKSIPIPASIGIANGCMNPLHTHDDGGLIHVESPEKRDFTLGDIFAVWKKPFTKNQIFDYKADFTHTIHVKVNDKEVDTYENTVVHDNDRIVIFMN